LGLFGAALLYGDGIITPAITVLAAVEGLGTATPALAPFVVPAAVVILFCLFVVQSRGTGTIGAVFGPVMLIWFATMAALGVRWILLESHIFAALDPTWAIRFFAA